MINGYMWSVALRGEYMRIQSKTGRSLVSRKLAGAIFAVFALFVQPLVALDVPSAFAAPVVNEVMPNPVTITDTQGEWVEIHNQGTEQADISGWTLNDGGSESYTFPSSTVLAGDEYYVVCRTMTTAEANCDAEWSSMSLLNAGDTVTLKNAATQPQDSFTYDGSNDGESVEAVREDNTTVSVNNSTDSYGTKGNTGTPGAANAAQPTGTVVNQTTGEHFTTIQAAIDDNETINGNTITIGADTYVEKLSITKSLHIVGEGEDSTIIRAPGSLTGAQAIVTVSGMGVSVEMSNLTVKGPGPTNCGSIYAGVYITGGANADLHDMAVNSIRDAVLSGCQNGRAIYIGGASVGTATITNVEVRDYQKSGIFVNNAGSWATIEDSYVAGDGATNVIAQNGITAYNGGGIEVTNTDVVSNSYFPDTNIAAGILLYDADSESVIHDSGNYITENEVGVYSTAPELIDNISLEVIHGNERNAVVDASSLTTPSTVYVDDELAGAVANDDGSDVVSVNGVNHIFGHDSFDTIQAAVSAVPAGGTVNVLDGSYTGDVTVSKAVSLVGPEADMGDVAQLTGQINVYASDVSVEGLKITNPSYAGGTTIRGVHVWGGNAGISNITIEGNTFSNIRNNSAKGAYAVMVQGNVSNVTVSGNTINGISSAGWAHGIEVTPAGGVVGVPQGVSIVGNSIEGVTNDTHGDQYDFSVDYSGVIFTDASQINFKKNQLSGVIRNLDQAHALDASENWWWQGYSNEDESAGVIAGPENSRYVGNVTTAPWCFHDDCTILASNEQNTTLPLTAPGVAQIPDTGFIFTESAATGNVRVVLEKDTTVTSSNPLWDGTIKAPTVISNYAVPGAKSTSLAISVGSDTDSLTFDKPVLLIFSGQAGKSVGFKKLGGVFTEITHICTSLQGNMGSIELEPGVNECKVSIGDDLFVITSHFTVFATYNKAITAPIDPVAEGDLGTQQGSISPLPTQGALTSAAITSSSADKTEKGEVLGTDTDGTDSNVDKVAAIAPSEEGWKLWGIAWYWWLLALAALGTGSWYAARLYRNRKADF